MALSEPFPLTFLGAALLIVDCKIELARFEEQSGSGSGQFWSSELADPLWQVFVSLAPCLWRQAREINAKVAALGTMKSFHFRDPTYAPGGGRSPGSGITISSISATRTDLALTGLPGGYVVTAGDRISILRSGASYYYGEFVETVAANGAGVTPQIAINPPLPLLVAAGASVALITPILRLRVPAGGFTPYTEMLGGYSSGAVLNMVQKR